MTNLGGHDLAALCEGFSAIDHDRPTCFICYTIKGFGLPLAGHKDNHAGLMTPPQVESLRASMNVRPGYEWDRFEGLAIAPQTLQTFLDGVPFAQRKSGRKALTVAVPDHLQISIQPTMSTQAGFGALLNEIARDKADYVARIVTTSPDVTVSTNLAQGPAHRTRHRRDEFVHPAVGARPLLRHPWPAVAADRYAL
jgi:pyruvate dehydrogenase E1 component